MRPSRIPSAAGEENDGRKKGIVGDDKGETVRERERKGEKTRNTRSEPRTEGFLLTIHLHSDGEQTLEAAYTHASKGY